MALASQSNLQSHLPPYLVSSASFFRELTSLFSANPKKYRFLTLAFRAMIVFLMRFRKASPNYLSLWITVAAATGKDHLSIVTFPMPLAAVARLALDSEPTQAIAFIAVFRIMIVWLHAVAVSLRRAWPVTVALAREIFVLALACIRRMTTWSPLQATYLVRGLARVLRISYLIRALLLALIIL